MDERQRDGGRVDYAAFLRAADAGQPPAVALLHGPEVFLLEDAVSRVGRGLFGDATDRTLAREVVEAREAGAAGIVEAALTLPWSGARRLVLARGIEELGGKGAGPITDYCQSPNPSTVLLLLAEQSLPVTHWLYKAVPRALIVAVAPPPAGQLAGWLRARARADGIDLDAEAAALLVELAGEDLARLHGEVVKAALAGGADNHRVGVDEVRAVVGETRARHVFDLTGALVERDLGSALSLLGSLLGAGEEPFALLGMLAREARAAWRAAEGLRQGRPEGEIARNPRPPARPGGGADRPRPRARARRRRETAPALLGGRAAAEAGRYTPGRAGAADRRFVRGVIIRAIGALTAALLVSIAFVPGLSAAVRAAPALIAGAAAMDLRIPEGAPLGGYGGFPRRAVIPDLLDRYPFAFWFRPSTGVHDPARARSLVLEVGATRVLWIAVDLVGIDPTLVAELGQALRRYGLAYSAIIVSASHTHSGPGAYADSALFGALALDRRSAAVRAAILDGFVRAAREAEAHKGPSRVHTGRTEVRGIAESRVGGPLDSELGVLRVTGTDGRPKAIVWNYAIHGTALGRDNFLLSGDLTGDASGRIERELGVPALFVNGAVGDVSPRPRGWDGVALAGSALAAGALRAWAEARPMAGPRLEVVTEKVALPSPALSLRNCLGRWIPSNMTLGLARALPSAAEVIGLGVGETAWVAIPGELETRLGLDIKTGAGGRFRHVFVAGVSNDYLGYFLAPAHYRFPSYIACGSLYGERGGEIVRDAGLAALRRLGSRSGR